MLYQAKNGTVAHEMILDCRAFKAVGIEVMDIAKRLIDYGFHAQPCLGQCRHIDGGADRERDLKKPTALLKPCCASAKKSRPSSAVKRSRGQRGENGTHRREATSSEWTHPYSREAAVYPVRDLRTNKFWAQWLEWTTRTVTATGLFLSSALVL